MNCFPGHRLTLCMHTVRGWRREPQNDRGPDQGDPQGLRVDLAAARLIIQKNDGLVTALAAAISPHIRCAGGLFVLLLEDLNRRLVAMDERLRSEPQLQGV